MPDNPKTKQLQGILALLTESVSKDEFLQATQALIKIVKDIKSGNETEWALINAAFQLLEKRLKDANTAAVADTQQEIRNSIVGQLEAVQAKLDSVDARVDSKLASVKDGEDGDDGEDAPPVDESKIVAEVLALIPPDVDETPVETRDKLEALKGDERLDASAIKGLPEATKQIAQQTPGWGAHPLSLYSSTGAVIDSVTRHIKFTGATLSRSPDGVVTVAVTGGSGFTTLAATETPNGSTTVFTFSSASAQPSYIVADNVWLRATSAASTVNWTWNSGTKQATLTIPPNDDIYAIV